MTLRLVVTGSECTGKTTLARRLAAHLGAPWLAETSRAYAIERLRQSRVLTAEDVEPIARLAMAAEDAALAGTPAILVLDTDLISTVVYARHYYGACPSWIEAEARVRRGDQYLLCSPDLPWLADGVRDQPAARTAIHRRFQDALEEFEVSVTTVAGSGGARDAIGVAVAAALAAEAGAPS